MRIFCSVLVLTALAACSAPSSAPLVPSGGVTPHGKTITVESFGDEGIINHTPVKDHFNATCKMTDVGGIGKLPPRCFNIKAKINLDIERLTVGAYTKRDATGCLAGVFHFKGKVPAGKDIPLVFKWTGKC